VSESGRRYLKSLIAQPTTNLATLRERQANVKFLSDVVSREGPNMTKEIQTCLKKFTQVELILR